MKTTKKILCMALAILMLTVSCTKKSNEKQILSFRFESLNVEAVIVEETKTISAKLPFDADVKNLTPIMVISEKATVNPGSGVSMDFTNPVTYTVTAEDGTQVEYLVSVNIENPFLGIWGVEKLEYYEIDNEGNPIASTMVTLNFNPNDIEDGIQLVFREDKTGELRNNYEDFNNTTNVISFTYTYYNDAFKLFIKEDEGYFSVLNIKELTSSSFVYESEYASNHIEKAYLKRLSYTPDKSIGNKFNNRPGKQGFLLSGK